MNLSEIVPAFKQAKNKASIKKKVGEFVVEQINLFLDGSISPVSRGKFRKFKKDDDASQLFESGSMRSAIESRPSPGGIKVGVFKDDEAIKAYAHNTGFRGHPTIKQGKFVRQFIPDGGQSFKKRIIDGAKRIIRKEIVI